jgi:energy-coupling factor transport system ATP-binding protein
VRRASALARDRGTAVVISEQRPELPLELADRVLFLDRGRLAFDGDVAAARTWLEREHPAYLVGGRTPDEAEPAEAVCTVAGVSFAYEDSLFVVDGADLELRRGEIVALHGPNGCGKTTLAKLAAGLLEPTRGRVERAGRATYLSQDPGRYVLRERAIDEVAVGADRDAAARALAAVGLAGYELRHPRDLSSGERERLALAAVLAPDPDLLVLDEPTRGVDPERKLELAGLLRAGAAPRATLLVTHDRAFAASVADRVVSLAREPEPVHA